MSIWKQKKIRPASLTGFRHDKERTLRRKRFLAAFLGFALLLLLLRTPAEHLLASVFHFAFRPVFVLQQVVSDTFSEYGYFFSSKKTLTRENVRLSDALDLIAVEGFSREALRKENDELKKVLGRNPDRPLLLARVLATPGSSPYDTLVIDVGSQDGIAKGMNVFTDGDFILGEITQVFLYSAVVTLYSTSGNEFTAIIGATSTPTTAYGVGGGNFRIILPKGIEVNLGDLVEVPALTPTYLGKVEAVVRPEGSSLQEIHIQWPLNVFALRHVYIEYAADEEVNVDLP